MIRTLLLSAALLATLAQAADAPAPADFAWRGRVEAPAAPGLVRVDVPGEALARMQSPAIGDLRVFDAAGHPVPFALATPPRAADAPRVQTAPFPALVLRSALPDRAAPPGSVQVRVQEGGEQRAFWVQVAPGPAASAPDAPARVLPSALFDLRRETRALSGLQVEARLPANAPVQLAVWSSPDLASWRPVAVRGRIYRFEGDGAPVNDVLEFESPLQPEGRYLRIDWQGQQGVAVTAVRGLVAPAHPASPAVYAPLPAARPDGPAALEWTLPFVTPLAALDLQPDATGTLVPVRVLGRSRPGEPWRLQGQGLLWRLAGDGGPNVNPPLPLRRTPLAAVRVEATHGMALAGVRLSARAVFDPVQVVFVAGGAGPFELAAGREDTAAASLPLGMLLGTASVRLDAVPLATIAQVQARPERVPAAWEAWLPRGITPRTAVLWAVLGLGVLVLGGVAVSLLRQMRRD